jgi:hypothetical protein
VSVCAAVAALVLGIAHAERAQDVGSFVAEDFATSMLHSWSFKTDKPGESK